MLTTTFKEHHASQSYYNDTQCASVGIKNSQLRKMGIQNFRKNEGVSFHDKKFSIAQSAQNSRKAQGISLRTDLDTKTSEPMALSIEAKGWLTKHGLEGLIRVAMAPPHKEPEKVALQIDLEEIMEEVVREGGL